MGKLEVHIPKTYIKLDGHERLPLYSRVREAETKSLEQAS